MLRTAIGNGKSELVYLPGHFDLVFLGELLVAHGAY